MAPKGDPTQGTAGGRSKGRNNDETFGANGARGEPLAKMKRPPTSSDVARLAGVSQSTVSHVLNDVAEGRYSEETREQVLAAATELGYVPHAMARSLRAGRSNLVLMPMFDWPYNPDSFRFFQTLTSHIDELGYTVMLQTSRSQPLVSAARTWASLRPIGVIAAAESLSRDTVNVLYKAGTRAIMAIGTAPSPFVPTILVDYTPAGRAAAQHLLSRGHDRLAVLLPHEPQLLPLGLQRLRGVEQVAREHGVRVEPVEMGYDKEDASRLAAWWRHGPRPDGVFTYNDDYGALLMSSLQQAGLSIPGDVALVGCDNLPYCELLTPSLTSVQTPFDTTTRSLAAYFDDLIQGRASGDPPPALELPQVIVRESS